MDARVLRTFEELVARPDGTSSYARIAGRRTPDDRWEAWIEFIPRGGGPVLRSLRETIQSDLPSLERWAERLSLVYIEGSMERTLAREGARPRPQVEEPEPPIFEGPAPDIRGWRKPPPDDVALNPILAFRRGEDHIRRRIAQLAVAELRAIARAYFDYGGAVDVEALERDQLEELIVEGARTRTG